MRSDSIDAEAIIFCRGCVCKVWTNGGRAVEGRAGKELTATETTTSVEPVNPRGKKKNGGAHTRVTLQNLNDLPTLQIPQIHLPVLTTRNYPFPTRHAETSDDAVFGVLVTGVSLEATRGLIVP